MKRRVSSLFFYIILHFYPLDRLIQEQGLDGIVSKYGYDAVGNRIESILPNGKKVNWHYKTDNYLERIEIDGKILTEYQRDALNREISKTQGLLQSTHEYDSLGRLIKQATHTKDKAQLLQRNYGYDKVGELLSIEDSRKGKFTYGYDKLGRVTHAKTPSKEETFTFDPAHNLIEKDDFFKHNNRVETYQDKRYTYDDFGNMQSKKISSHTHMEFEYNLEHQMKKAKVTKKNITQTYTYGYDPFGRRVTKTDDFGTTYFTWDGNRLLSEKRGTKEQTYIYEHEGFVPLATLDAENNISYYHTDHLGTPQEMTNSEGEVVWEAEYTTWGNTAKVSYKQRESTIEEQEELALQPLRFQGQYYDKETGLHYNRFRYYDPDVGRFTTQDPIGLLGGDNLYQYAPNPVAWVDPLGLSCSLDAKKLRDNMKKEGITEPNYKNSAHHTVMSNTKNPQMTAAREHMNNMGIDINDASNGTYLPTSSSVANSSGTKSVVHSKVHTKKYMQYVSDKVLGAKSKEKLKSVLKAISNKLKDGTCPH